MALAREVEAEAKNKKTARMRGDVRVLGDPLDKMKKLKGELEKALVDIHNSLAAGSGNRQKDSKDEKHSLKDVVCYGCGERGQVKRRCHTQAEAQRRENVSWQLDRQ